MNNNVEYLLKVFDGDKDRVIAFLIERNSKLEKTMTQLQEDVIDAIIAHKERSGQVMTRNSKWEE